MPNNVLRNQLETGKNSPKWDKGPGGGRGGGLLLGILGRGVPPGSSNPDHAISDQNIQFFTPVFRPGL